MTVALHLADYKYEEGILAMLRSLALSVTVVILASLSTPAFAAETTAGGGPTSPCVDSEPVTPTAQNGPFSGPGPAPIKVLPGEHRPAQLANAVRGAQTRDEWIDEKGLLHIYETIDYHSPGLRVNGATAISLGRLASVSRSCTEYLGYSAPVAVNTVCGGGCITQKQQWTVDYYRNTLDTNNTYYQRKEVRVWWERSGSTYITWSGDASTRFAESMDKCDGSFWNRDVTSTWTPAWQTDWRSYDYYWDETWMPIMGGPGTKHMLVQTTTPTNYGTNLFTQQTFE